MSPPKFFTKSIASPPKIGRENSITILEMQIDFNSLREICHFFQSADGFGNNLSLVVTQLHELEAKLPKDFYSRVQNSAYPFSATDVYECSRVPIYYALTDEIREIFSLDSSVTQAIVVAPGNLEIATEILRAVKRGLVHQGFSAEESDLLIYLVLQTTGAGISNILYGGSIVAFSVLLDVIVHQEQLPIRAYKKDGKPCVLLSGKIFAKDDDGQIQRMLAVYKTELQVTRMELTVSMATFTVTDKEVICKLAEALEKRGFWGVVQGNKKIFMVNSTNLITNSAAQEFIALRAQYSKPERDTYRNQEGHHGEFCLCLDIINMGIKYNYEFEMVAFALEKILRLLEEGRDDKKIPRFTRGLISPQLFALPHFTDSITSLVERYSDQFIDYIMGLREEDIADNNADGIAIIIAELIWQNKIAEEKSKKETEQDKGKERVPERTEGKDGNGMDMSIFLPWMMQIMSYNRILIDQFLQHLSGFFSNQKDVEFDAYLRKLFNEPNCMTDQCLSATLEVIKRSYAFGFKPYNSPEIKSLASRITQMVRVSSLSSDDGKKSIEEELKDAALAHVRHVEARAELINGILEMIRKSIILLEKKGQNVQLNVNQAILERFEVELIRRLRDYLEVSLPFLQMRLSVIYGITEEKRAHLVTEIMGKITNFRDTYLPTPKKRAVTPSIFVVPSGDKPRCAKRLTYELKSMPPGEAPLPP